MYICYVDAKIKHIEDKTPGITNLATNTTLDAKINEVKNEISRITNLATNASLKAKINEVNGEIHSITNLTTTPAFTAVENKIPNVNDLVKKADYDAEIKDIKDKYLSTFDYNKFTNNIFDEKITANKLVNESGLNEKIKILATKEEIEKLAIKAELKVEQDKIVKLQTYDLSHFIGQSYFVNDGAQLYLILQPLYYTLKRLGDTEKVVSWKLKALPTEKLTIPTTADNSLSPSIKWYKNSNSCLIFKGNCVKQIYSSKYKNFFIVYESDTWSRDLNSDLTLKECLFRGVILAKNADPDKYVYSGYGFIT